MSSRNDFDFIIGRWNVRHRKLRQRLAGCDEWIEFDGTAEAFKFLDGWGNIKCYRWELDDEPFEGAAIRIFNPRTRLWTIWWADTRTFGFDDVPVVGAFDGPIGTFYSEDTWEGRAVRVRYIYDATTPGVVVWQQAFSVDGGATWETNWIMTATREAA
ncbi:MAG TPA: DUF1579 domain-containing protein [Thermoanaerobaculia bacterium]|jgi:hypothetical protein